MRYQNDPVALSYVQSLNEGKISNKIIGAVMGASIAAASLVHTPTTPEPTPITQSTPKKKEHTVDSLTDVIKSSYKHLSPDLAAHVATLAKKHEKADFPKAEHILSVIGIESSFNPEAKSNLKKDKAIGLMQIRPKTNGVSKSELSDLDSHIAFGADKLHKLYHRLGNVDDAIHSYNIGVGRFLKGDELNPSYVEKFKRELQKYQ